MVWSNHSRNGVWLGGNQTRSHSSRNGLQIHGRTRYYQSYPTVPEEFKCHMAQFSEEEASKFPPSRGEGDHKVSVLMTHTPNIKASHLALLKEEAIVLAHFSPFPFCVLSILCDWLMNIQACEPSSRLSICRFVCFFPFSLFSLINIACASIGTHRFLLHYRLRILIRECGLTTHTHILSLSWTPLELISRASTVWPSTLQWHYSAKRHFPTSQLTQICSSLSSLKTQPFPMK